MTPLFVEKLVTISFRIVERQDQNMPGVAGTSEEWARSEAAIFNAETIHVQKTLATVWPQMAGFSMSKAGIS